MVFEQIFLIFSKKLNKHSQYLQLYRWIQVNYKAKNNIHHHLFCCYFSIHQFYPLWHRIFKHFHLKNTFFQIQFLLFIRKNNLYKQITFSLANFLSNYKQFLCKYLHFKLIIPVFLQPNY